MPIIVLGGSTDVVDRVLLLELGADDYVTKPFSLRELLARVRAVIRSTRKPLMEAVEFDGICLDFTRMEAMRDGKPIALTASEFRILKFFVHNENRTISRDELLKQVLGRHDSSTRIVDNHILKLRQKLETDPANPILFRTDHGTGYRFVR